MADDKDAREEQAQREERRQQDREVAAALERADEPEPPLEEVDLGGLAAELDAFSYPATGDEVVETLRDRRIETPERTYRGEELLAATDAETFESSSALRERLQRPTVARAMKRVVEAIAALPNASFGASQRDAYQRTFEELEAIDAVDEDEGIAVLTDWLLERIEQDESVPGSRDLRRKAAKFCRENGYTVRNDEWLGV